jgi:hypothetical protein
MILSTPRIDPEDLARETGWRCEPRGLCRGDVCVPFVSDGGPLDARAVAAALGMPLVADAAAELWALGPPSGGRALVSATAPDLELPDLDGRPFRLSSLRGWKVLLVAWAPW